MNYLLVLSLVGLLSVSVNGLPLNAICVQDHFDYDGRTVNAYLKVPLESTFEPIEDFTIQIPAGFKAIQDEFLTEAEEVVRIKNLYDELILGAYTQQYLTKLDTANIQGKKRRLVTLKLQTRNVYQTIFILSGGLDVANKIQEEFQGKFVKANEFLDTLLKLKEGMVTETLFTKSELNSTLDHLGEPQAGQVAIFDKRSSDAFYSQSLYKVVSAKLNKKSNLFFDKQTTATVAYSLHLPFGTQEPVKDGNCTQATELPMFFRNKKA